MRNSTLYLLPNYFKKIAAGLLVSLILFAILVKLAILSMENELVKPIWHNGLLIGLLIPAISKDKIEDELIIKIRMEAFVSAFIIGVLFVILAPLINVVFGGGYENTYGASQLIFFMLLWFHFIYFSTKRAR